jgi:hypothetical protein
VHDPLPARMQIAQFVGLSWDSAGRGWGTVCPRSSDAPAQWPSEPWAALISDALAALSRPVLSAGWLWIVRRRGAIEPTSAALGSPRNRVGGLSAGVLRSSTFQ